MVNSWTIFSNHLVHVLKLLLIDVDRVGTYSDNCTIITLKLLVFSYKLILFKNNFFLKYSNMMCDRRDIERIRYRIKG